MKTLKPLLILLSLTAGLTACDPIKGTLQVLQAFTARVGSSTPCTGIEYPCFDQPSDVTIHPGSHHMTIAMLGRDLVQIQLNSQLIELNVPRGKDIPATGAFSLTAQESGQPFDLQAQTKTTVSQTEETHTDETCDIAYQEYVCGVTGHPPQPHCWYETHYRPGLKEVSYYFETTRQDMKAHLAQRSTRVAVFDGSRSESRKIYTYQGHCRPRHW